MRERMKDDIAAKAAGGILDTLEDKKKLDQLTQELARERAETSMARGERDRLRAEHEAQLAELNAQLSAARNADFDRLLTQAISVMGASGPDYEAHAELTLGYARALYEGRQEILAALNASENS